MENIAHIQAMTVLAVGIIFGMGALGTAIGFGILGGRFLEGVGAPAGAAAGAAACRCSSSRACWTRWR